MVTVFVIDDYLSPTGKLPIFINRVINSTLYYDWPWNIERFSSKQINDSRVNIYKIVLDKIYDIKDSVFLVFSDELSMLPSDFPFPALIESPNINNIGISLFRGYLILVYFHCSYRNTNPLESCIPIRIKDVH